MKIRKKIHNNKIINFAYKIYFYFTLGKGQLAKFTDPIQDVSGVVIIIVMVLGINLTQYKSLFGLFVILFISFLIFTGWLFKNSGLWEVELEVNTKKNHIASEMYEAAKKINKKFKRYK